MSNILETIKAKAKENYNEVVNIRRHLHQNPELSFKEYKTSAYIKQKLTEFGIDYIDDICDTGLVAIIKGKNPNKSNASFRADMDALPITEKNECEYKSLNEGVMHACGHDVHSSSLLVSAKILNELKDSFEGTIQLIFQPGEEKLPGGASQMIKEGLFENFPTKYIAGQHVFPELEAGKIGFKKGIYMASCDEIYITIKGKGGHGAMPHNCLDPILMSAHLITSLQQIISRNANALIPSVLSFGKIIGNGATNVIPEKVLIEGTFRTFDENWRIEAHKKMKLMGTSLVEGMGGECDFNVVKGYPCLVNNEELTSKAKDLAINYFGKDNVIDIEMRMTAEDFSYYSHELPATFYRLGTRNEKLGLTHPVHSPNFNIDERALEAGIGFTSWLLINLLKE